MVGSIYDWTLNAPTNDVADAAINWAEFQNPDTVNNSARQMMARHAEVLRDATPTRTMGGVANIYTVALASNPTALVDGLVVYGYVNVTNTGVSTLAVSTALGTSFGAKPLRAKSSWATAFQSSERFPKGSSRRASRAHLTGGCATMALVAKSAPRSRASI